MTGWIIECPTCGHTYAVDRAAIMAERWQVCPACQDAPGEARQADTENTTAHGLGPPSAPQGHSRPATRLGAGMPDRLVSPVLSAPERSGGAS